MPVPPKAKTVCPISRSEFRQFAEGLKALINGKEIDLPVKEFSTGSLGWYANGKVKIELPNGQRVECQLGLNLTIVGSKELP